MALMDLGPVGGAAVCLGPPLRATRVNSRCWPFPFFILIFLMLVTEVILNYQVKAAGAHFGTRVSCHLKSTRCAKWLIK